MRLLCALLPLLACAAAYEWHEGECGKSPFPGTSDYMGFIVGGQEAKPNDFPWQILMTNRDRFSCGGIVINDRWVMTAAHCVGSSPSGLGVYAGRHKICSGLNCPYEASSQKRTISRVVRHQHYNSRTMDNDIALLKLDSPFNLNAEVMPACKPQADNTYEGARAWVSGWGTTRSGGSIASRLRYVGVPVITNEACNTSPRLRGAIKDSMMCAGELPEYKYDACQGDSGGPLVTKNAAGAYELIGVVSWGYGCASGDPGVYARVPHLLDWVDEMLERYDH